MAMASTGVFRSCRKIFVECHHHSQVSIHQRQFHILRIKSSRYILQKCNENSTLKYLPLTSISGVRWASQGKGPITFDDASLPPIPTPPAPLPLEADSPTIENIIEGASAVLTEPSLASYGLANWTPVGLVQSGLEFCHITLGLPWWGSIVAGTVVLRILVFPLVILAQRNAARMGNNLPQMQRLQAKMTEARQSGNNFEAARIGQEMMVFMKEKGMNPLANMFPPLAQAPLFISMFMGLRAMSNVPVESLKTGGLFWFLDLTVPDQYYLLPIITSLTLSATIELGTDGAKAESLGMMRYAFRCLPIVIFPFTFNFPAAILCYWVSTNFISLIQVGILRIPKVRNYFNIEATVYHPKDKLAQKKGFVEGFKESMSNMKITRQLAEREHIDATNFQKAGRAPIQRTFKHDPTRVQPKATNELLAKRKES